MKTYAEHKAHLVAIEALLAQCRDACNDWDGTPLADGAEPRVTVTCNALRMLVAEVDRLTAALVQARKDMNEEIREAGRDARAAVAEAYWQGEQDKRDGIF